MILDSYNLKVSKMCLPQVSFMDEVMHTLSISLCGLALGYAL
jgi:hypothetical protein